MTFRLLMSLFFSFSLLSCGSSDSLTSLSGHPDEDPVVQQLRTQVLKGSVPSGNSLYFGETWNLREHAAWRGSTIIRNGSYKFTQIGETVEMRSTTDSHTVYLALNSDGLQGRSVDSSNNQFIVTFRFVKRGVLAGEVAWKNTSQLDESLSAISQLKNQGYAASSYISLTLASLNPSDPLPPPSDNTLSLPNAEIH